MRKLIFLFSLAFFSLCATAQQPEYKHKIDSFALIPPDSANKQALRSMPTTITKGKIAAKKNISTSTPKTH